MKNSKTFKRLLCLALAVLCLASLAACSKNDGSGDGTSVAGGTHRSRGRDHRGIRGAARNEL